MTDAGGPDVRREERRPALPLNPSRVLACPLCYSQNLYIRTFPDRTCCAACGYSTTQRNLTCGEAKWWERAAVAAANQWNPGQSGMRPACPNCYGVSWTHGLSSGRYTCKTCRTVWPDSATDVPHFRDRLLAVDGMQKSQYHRMAVPMPLDLEYAPKGETPAPTRPKRRIIVE